MSLHIHHCNIVGVYCHGVWYECVKGSFGCDAFEVQIYGDIKDLDTKEGSPARDWIVMGEVHSEVPCASTAAYWIDPETDERVSVFMYDIKAFRELFD